MVLNLKSYYKKLRNPYFLETILWFFLTFSLFACVVFIRISQSKTNTNFFFNYLLRWDFFNNGWNFSEHSLNSEYIASFTAYLAMAVLFSTLCCATLFLIQIKIFIKNFIEQKFHVNSDLRSNFFIFKNLLFVNVTRNVTYIFCFTSAITFILVVIYIIVHFFLQSLIHSKFKLFNLKKSFKQFKSQQKITNISIFGLEIFYFVFKNFLTSVKFDLDQILKYFIPASSLALIIAVFIQSLFRNDVKKILNNINKIATQADNFQIFYHLEKEKVLNNYEFVKELPAFIKTKLKKEKTTNSEVIAIIVKIYNLINHLEKKKKNSLLNLNEYNYLNYQIFYEISSEKELDNLISHVKKANLTKK